MNTQHCGKSASHRRHVYSVQVTVQGQQITVYYECPGTDEK